MKCLKPKTVILVAGLGLTLYLMLLFPSQALPKYFLETPDGKRDARFGNRTLGIKLAERAERHQILTQLFGLWTEFSAEHKIPYWLAHGTLVGWHWGKKLMPWDEDIDLQMKLSDLEKITHLSGTQKGRALFEINPNFVDRTVTRGDKNVIDARFIDTKSGYFIDITAVIPVLDYTYLWMCKTPWKFPDLSLFPLIPTTLEGFDTFIPSDYADVLNYEYRYWKSTTFSLGDMTYTFNQDNQEWVLRVIPGTCLLPNGKNYEGTDCSQCPENNRCNNRGQCYEGLCDCHANYSGTFCHACASGFYFQDNKCFQYLHFERLGLAAGDRFNLKKFLSDYILALVIGGPWLVVCCCACLGHGILSKMEADVEKQRQKGDKAV